MLSNIRLPYLSQRLVAVTLVACLIPVPAAAQLTGDQKIHDFENLAAIYAKRYAPYEWKKQLFEFDLFLHGNEPAKNAQGNVIAYTKPLILLVDDFTISAGDIFSAMLQDNRRGALVGTRTNGAGGSTLGLPAGTYSESNTSNTNTLVTRIAPVKVEGYPEAHYVENIGAHADIRLDYMTRENLLMSGRPFVQAFTAIVADQVRTASECRYAGPPQCAPPEAPTSSSSSSSAPQPAGAGSAFQMPPAAAGRVPTPGDMTTGSVAQPR